MEIAVNSARQNEIANRPQSFRRPALMKSLSMALLLMFAFGFGPRPQAETKSEAKVEVRGDGRANPDSSAKSAVSAKRTASQSVKSLANAKSADFKWVRSLLGDLRADDAAEDAIKNRLGKLPDIEVDRLAKQLAVEVRGEDENDRHYALDAIARWRRVGIPAQANLTLWAALEAQLAPLSAAPHATSGSSGKDDVKSSHAANSKLWAQWAAASAQAGKLDASRRRALFEVMNTSSSSIVTRLSLVTAAMDAGVPADARELDLLLKSPDPELRLAALDWLRISPTEPAHVEKFLRAARESKPKQLRERVYRSIASWDQPEAAYQKSLKRALPKNCNLKDDAHVVKACQEALKKWSGGEL